MAQRVPLGPSPLPESTPVMNLDELMEISPESRPGGSENASAPPPAKTLTDPLTSPTSHVQPRRRAERVSGVVFNLDADLSDEDEEMPVEVEEEEEAPVEEEEEDSEALARRLMMEESLLAYRQLQQASVQMALQSLEGDLSSLDEDTRLSLQLMQQELQSFSGGEEANMTGLVVASQVAQEADAVEEEGLEDVDDYEALLQLGNAMGDVRRERWQARSETLIARLPRRQWPLEHARSPVKADSMCPICRCDYEEGEQLLVLPCRHGFHDDCCGTWLKDNENCPICKHPIEQHATTSAEAQPSID
jgi:hypothetical protein